MTTQPVPTYTDFIVAWRGWHVHDTPDGPALTSTGDGLQEWPAGVPLQARHNIVGQSGERLSLHHDGAAVPQDCICGIYAVKDPLKTIGMVMGRVALWGQVHVHQNGYRAEYAYPLSIEAFWCHHCNVVFPVGQRAGDCLRNRSGRHAMFDLDALAARYNIPLDNAAWWDAYTGAAEPVRTIETMAAAATITITTPDSSKFYTTPNIVTRERVALILFFSGILLISLPLQWYPLFGATIPQLALNIGLLIWETRRQRRSP